MRILNTKDHFGIVAILLHWVMAAIIIFLIAIGLYMTRIPTSLQKLKLFGWHKEWGILVLFFIALRLIWLLITKMPPLPLNWPRWQRASAHTVHILLYLCMIVLPLTGLLLTSAAGLPASFFGWFVVPDMINANPQLQMVFVNLHVYLSYFMIVLLCLHIAAALKHHFIDKDDTLRRIL